jgi:glycosyltransferase involved in cell wall biosynthesis
MRVLHINAGNMYGGVETLLATLARCRNLCQEMQPSFALCFEGRLSRELADTGVPVFFVGETRTSRFWSVLKARRRMRELLHEHKFDVVVTHMSWSHAIFGPEAKRAGIPIVNWIHGVPNGRHWLERWASRTAPKLVICNSQFTARSLHLAFESVDHEVIYCPVEPSLNNCSDRRETRAKLGAREGDVVILQVSRMESLKGHSLHLKALAQLRDLPNWVCWIAGGAQLLKEQNYLYQLQDEATQLKIAQRVRFLGQRSDVAELMAAADIFCQPNEQPEAFGITFVEALYAGLPIVTTAMGGAMEILDESCGLLTEPGNMVELGESLQQLIESPTLRAHLGRGGASRARQLCDPGTQTNRVGALTERVAGCGTPVPQ